MKRTMWVAAACLIVIMANIVILAPRLEDKRNALGRITGFLFNSENHPLAVIESGGLVISAQHNFSVITRATEYIATLGSNTLVFKEIVRIAANTSHECPRLERMLDLAVVCQSDSKRVIALAAEACKIETAEEESAWQEAYDALWDSADFASVEAALSALAIK